MPNNTKNFKVDEFACKCCGKNEIDKRVIDLAQTIREEVGVPVRVNSGYRCKKHNKEVGGVQEKFDKNGKLISKGSNHMYGLAADLSCSLGAKKLYSAIQKLYKEGKIPQLGYCIRYATFCHVDVVKRKSGNVWEVRA